MKFITYAIDLGTTNSLIAKHENGLLEVFRNPVDNNEILPSVVAFKDNEVIIGNKALKLRSQGLKHVYSSFKRKIGTDVKFNLGVHETDPVQLSTHILLELKKFIRSEKLEAVVITVPASFNTVQANATKLAAEKAGIKEVVLLQEPIAACLSIFNEDEKIKKNGKCLVFDLGGGTFDIALVAINPDELRILDHEGNNFLGGLDFDLAIVEKSLLHQLAKIEHFERKSNELFIDLFNGKYSKEFNLLLGVAEELKKELTFNEKASISVYLTNDLEQSQELSFDLNRSEFNEAVLPYIQQTIDLTKSILQKNNVTENELIGVVLVGGATYIPEIKNQIQQQLNIHCLQVVDPSTAIVRGAAYYAGNKPKFQNSTNDKELFSVIYDKQTRDKEALIIINCADSKVIGSELSIYNKNKTLVHQFKVAEQQQIFLELEENCLNIFEIVEIETKQVLSTIAIDQGKFVIDGQPLPHDICIEVDDIHSGKTKLDVIFEKNKTLPIQRVISKWVNKDLLQGSENRVIVNLLEGDRMAPPSICDIIGSIEINPNVLNKNIPLDTEIQLEITITENRDVNVSIQIPSLQFKHKASFNSNQKSISLLKLKEDVKYLLHEINKEFSFWMDSEAYEKLEEITQLKKKCESCESDLATLKSNSNDKVHGTFEHYRKIAIQFDDIQRKNHLRSAIFRLRFETNQLDELSEESDFPNHLKFRYLSLKETEGTVIQDGNLFQIKRLSEQYSNLIWEFRKNNTESMKSLYLDYRQYPADAFSDPEFSQKMITAGDSLLEIPSATAKDYLRIIYNLYHVLKDEWKNNGISPDFDMNGTGLR